MNNSKALRKFWKNNLPKVLLGAVLLLSLTAPAKIVNACGPILEFRGYSFIKPDIVDIDSGFAPFFLDLEQVEAAYVGQQTVTQQGNVQEWQDRICKKAKIPDIDYLIYIASVRDLERLKTSIVSPSVKLGGRLASNTFARFLVRNKCVETVDYLVFAKDCEPYVGQLDPWKNEKRDVESMEFLIQDGLEKFKEVESHYIKLRYAFQIIRLIHYAKQHKRVLETYEYLMPKIDNDPSIIEDWIECHRAGAMMSLDRKVEASYLFSKIFGDCPSRRRQAYQSFRLETEEEWEQCLKLCKTDRERANLYAMRANERTSNIAQEMYHVYRFDPDNENLELLLIQELKRLETDLLGVQFNDNKAYNQRNFGIPRTEAGKYVLDLKDFVQMVLSENKVPKPGLWKVAEGYLEMLAGNYYSAARTFEHARKMVTSDTLAQQLEVFEMALQISSYNEVNDAIEREAAQLYRNDLFEEFGDFRDFMGDRFAKLYADKGYPGKSFIMHHPLEDLKPNPKLEIIEDLIRVARKPRQNRFERAMVTSPYNDTTTIENDLLEMKATYFLNNFMVEAAMETMLEMNREEWDNYGLHYPFVDRIHDCVHCPLPDSVTVLNKGQLMDRIIDLEYRARAEPREAARYYYQLGLAYYNMTYFGNAWKVTDYFRSGSSLPRWNNQSRSDVMYHPDFPYGNKENFDCSKALYYFEKARVATQDPILGAKATYMAAKCERNEHYVNGTQRTFQYFEMLRNNFSATNAFKRQVIEECRHFSAYISR